MSYFDEIITAVVNGWDTSEYDPEDVAEAEAEVYGARCYEAIVGWHWDNR